MNPLLSAAALLGLSGLALPQDAPNRGATIYSPKRNAERKQYAANKRNQRLMAKQFRKRNRG